MHFCAGKTAPRTPFQQPGVNVRMKLIGKRPLTAVFIPALVALRFSAFCFIFFVSDG